MENLKQLKDRLAKATKERNKALKERVETIRIENQIKLIESDSYEDRLLFKEDSNKLDGYIKLLDEEYDNLDRKMAFVFGYGILPSKILTIVKAVAYLPVDVRNDMMEMMNLDENLIEETIEAFGSPAYYSKVSMEIVEAVDMDLVGIESLLEECAMRMELVSELKLDKFSHSNVLRIYDRAQKKATETEELNNKYLKEATNYEE